MFDVRPSRVSSGRGETATEVYAHFAPDALKRAADARAEAMRAAVEGANGQKYSPPRFARPAKLDSA